MNNIDKQYLDLLKDIRENGVKKEGRNGVTYSVFGRQIRHDMREGFPLLTTKKMYWKGIVTELLWFLSGNTNIQPLVKQGNNIWVGDAYKNYLEGRNIPELGNHDTYNECYCGHTDVCDCGSMSKAQFIEKIKNDDDFAEKWGDMKKIYGWQWRKWGEMTDDEKYERYLNIMI